VNVNRHKHNLYTEAMETYAGFMMKVCLNDNDPSKIQPRSGFSGESQKVQKLSENLPLLQIARD